MLGRGVIQLDLDDLAERISGATCFVSHLTDILIELLANVERPLVYRLDTGVHTGTELVHARCEGISELTERHERTVLETAHRAADFFAKVARLPVAELKDSIDMTA
jgi:hypothetical protein